MLGQRLQGIPDGVGWRTDAAMCSALSLGEDTVSLDEWKLLQARETLCGTGQQRWEAGGPMAEPCSHIRETVKVVRMLKKMKEGSTFNTRELSGMSLREEDDKYLARMEKAEQKELRARKLKTKVSVAAGGIVDTDSDEERADSGDDMSLGDYGG